VDEESRKVKAAATNIRQETTGIECWVRRAALRQKHDIVASCN
jgi:hypothetical protein